MLPVGCPSDNGIDSIDIQNSSHSSVYTLAQCYLVYLWASKLWEFQFLQLTFTEPFSLHCIPMCLLGSWLEAPS